MSLDIFRRIAPLFRGAIFLMGLTVLSACEKKQTPSVETKLPTIEQAKAEAAPAVAVPAKAAESTATAEKESPPSKEESDEKSGIRFTAYNVANWLTMEERFDFDTKKTSKDAPKPDEEKCAVIDILVSTNPDVVGVCEIGTREDLAEIQSMLKAKGYDFPHSHFQGGVDTTRHLGLLSRHPIVSTAETEKSDYRISGKNYLIQRGILDATVKTPDGREWRFLGIHLKSKREVEDGDQNLMRINEAQLLRRHIDGIFQKDAQARLICYGDFNDTRRTSPLRIVQGSYNSPTYMSPIGLHDSRYEYWTHFWEREDVYSRFDYIHFSPALKNDILFKECGIVDLPYWRKGSDHRATYAVFR